MVKHLIEQICDSPHTHTHEIKQIYTKRKETIERVFASAKESIVGQVLNLDSDVKIIVLNSGEGLGDNNEASVALKTTYLWMTVIFLHIKLLST